MSAGRLFTLLLALGLGLIWPSAFATQPGALMDEEGSETLLIVALADKGFSLPPVGGTPRAAYGASQTYAASPSTQTLAAEIARSHGLAWRAAWTIAPLKLHCILFRISSGQDRDRVLQRLQADDRVALAQPLNQFETLGEASAAAEFNDPYWPLQRGFARMEVIEAQRWTRGEGVKVALIDTGLDARHPDLLGRVQLQRDFVGPAHPPPPQGERHGTQMAGVIAAVANNQIGIVGMAPQARLLSFRACWERDAAAARCDSFTLAQALGAAIAAEADIINLSLGGPADPLLSLLTGYALKRGVWVLGALPLNGSLQGFPANVAGVQTVSMEPEGADAAAGVAGESASLLAPGREVLTLSPGGRYDYASGSSLATAHATGLAALLRSLPLQGTSVQRSLRELLAPAGTGPSLNACQALKALRPQQQCRGLAKTP
ncbi:serine protease [Paucibacter sp. KBW04]|uniref:S8 family peptidase n=1 Tax=Paucibacter sp. KBW04 TaxID=2153361 RepID=UPI000F57B034|nr:S8 family serine peptidase [Paucibacter sp. KBW04]RQO53688.1 serine protease [Paucibacter sp. KBW04]